MYPAICVLSCCWLCQTEKWHIVVFFYEINENGLHQMWKHTLSRFLVMHLRRYYYNKNHLAQVIIIFNSARTTVTEACCALMKFLMLRFKICKANIIYIFALGCFFLLCFYSFINIWIWSCFCWVGESISLMSFVLCKNLQSQLFCHFTIHRSWSSHTYDTWIF